MYNSWNYNDQQAGYVIQGHNATSYEYNIAVALYDEGFDFVFQYQISGGKTRIGGQVIYFLVYTAPLNTPLEVNGDHWHKDAETESKQVSSINEYGYGRWFPLIIAWGADAATPQQAKQFIKKKFGGLAAAFGTSGQRQVPKRSNTYQTQPQTTSGATTTTTTGAIATVPGAKKSKGRPGRQPRN